MRQWLCPILWELLKRIDLKIASDVKANGCDRCGGILDWANFPRKPRGFDNLDNEHRLSFCCRDCRKRTTPSSVRFLWRKIYILLAVAMEPERMMIGVCRQTIKRWRIFWDEELSVKSLFCQHFRFKLPVDFSFNLNSMINVFSTSLDFKFISMANFLCPLGCAPWLRFRKVRAEDGR